MTHADIDHFIHAELPAIRAREQARRDLAMKLGADWLPGDEERNAENRREGRLYADTSGRRILLDELDERDRMGE